MEGRTSEVALGAGNLVRYLHNCFAIWIACLAGGIILSFVEPVYVFDSPLRWLGPIVIAVGILSWGSAEWIFRSKGASPDELFRIRPELITSGPYRYSRNPIYLGMFLVILGVAFTMGALLLFLSSAVFFTSTNFLIIPKEEIELKKKFGDTYTKYKEKVRRWI